jgi:hypothetical protein
MDPTGSHISSVSAAVEHEGSLFMGNLHGDYVSYIDLVSSVSGLSCVWWWGGGRKGGVREGSRFIGNLHGDYVSHIDLVSDMHAGVQHARVPCFKCVLRVRVVGGGGSLHGYCSDIVLVSDTASASRLWPAVC